MKKTFSPLSEFRQEKDLLVVERVQARKSPSRRRPEKVLLAVERVQARKSPPHLRVSSGKMN